MEAASFFVILRGFKGFVYSLVLSTIFTHLGA